MTAPLWKGSRFPIQTCISGWAMLNGKAAVIPDIYRDQRIPHSLYRPTFVSASIGFVRAPLAPAPAWINYWRTPTN